MLGQIVGFQACGDVGAGRMSEPAEIFESLQSLFAVQQDLSDLSVTITAGPTREAIDPVRYIGNRSSGKSGVMLLLSKLPGWGLTLFWSVHPHLSRT